MIEASERFRRSAPAPSSGPAVHQFHASTAYGDAVTNGLLFTRTLLRELGFASEVYAEHVAPQLADEVRPYASYRPDPRNVLLVHHSMGHDRLDWLLELPDRKLLVYHNITPGHFFPDDPFLRKYADIGRTQLEALRGAVVHAICDSQFNADELRDLGYAGVTVLPLLLDTDAVRQAAWNRRLVDEEAARFTMLFVGRVERNKCQHDLLEVLRHVARWLDRDVQLALVGNYNSSTSYVHDLRRRARDCGVGRRVRLLGHVPTEDVYAWYRAAGVFVCMSEHEGFGVPLIEAMCFDLPVIAYASSNVPHTLGGAGILATDKRPEELAALVCLLAEDRALRRAVVRGQRARLRAFDRGTIRRDLAALLGRLGVDAPARPDAGRVGGVAAPWQLEGPLETSYSLALVNRELARALEAEAPGTVAAFATEGPGDYEPQADLVRADDLLPTLLARGRKQAQPDVLVRNLYPPRVADMDGLVNLLYFFWEESALPAEWVDRFNRHLDAVLAPSTQVAKVLVDAGVRVPVHVVGAGIDHVRRLAAEPYPGALGRGFRFLHVSSAFPRKGVDALLAAYARAFSARDEVTLVLKTFPNPHNETRAQIEALRARRADCPAIVHVDADLPAAQLLDLYRRCHAFVAPSRGEGFGLPMAEAMWVGLPVVTTAFGGQRDFCTDDRCWTVDFRFGRAGSHLDVDGSVWVEPDVDDLARRLREVYEASDDERRRRTAAAREAVERELRWSRVAGRVRAAVRAVEARPPLVRARPRIGWVSSWNCRCGIATYSEYLVRALAREDAEVVVFASRRDDRLRDDEVNVRRCWTDGHRDDLAELAGALIRERVDVAVLQFNFGFFRLDAFAALVDRLVDAGIRVVVAFHSTRDVGDVSLRHIRDTLARADRLLVHGVDDLNVLKDFGLVDNLTLFPHGVVERAPADPLSRRARLELPAHGRIVGSFGFLLPRKGIEQLVDAFPAVLRQHPTAHLLLVNALYPIADSVRLRDECVRRIEVLGIGARVTMINDFLDDDEIFALLEATDVVVFPYQQTAESASGAVRIGLASGRPVACTPLPIFDELAGVVHVLPGTEPAAIAHGLSALLADAARLRATHAAQERWRRAHGWSTLARRLAGLLATLVGDGGEVTVPRAVGGARGGVSC